MNGIYDELQIDEYYRKWKYLTYTTNQWADKFS